VARQLAEQDGVPPSMLRLAYNGLDTRVFRREGERVELPWGDEAAAVIGTVCALRPEKGLHILMEAFRKVKATRRGVKLVIVGSGPMLADLEAGGDADCHFQPAERNVAPWLRAMDIFVLPSLSEALSNSLMEAMGCGCCPVASDTGGNPELVTDGETGLLFPVADAEALAARLALLLDQPAYRRRLAAQAERRIEQHSRASRRRGPWGRSTRSSWRAGRELRRH
jgi:glycosyltransferase involved in cell wall biosynthesis